MLYKYHVTRPAHWGPTQKLAQPNLQGEDFPGVGVVGSTCLAARHSFTLGMMGPLKHHVTSRLETDRVIVPDTVLAAGELPVAVPEEDTLPVLLLALLKVSEGGAAGRGVAGLLALVRTSTSILQSDFLRYFHGTSKTNAML